MSNINIHLPSAEEALEHILSYSRRYTIQRHFEILYRKDKKLFTGKYEYIVYNKIRNIYNALYKKTIPDMEIEIESFLEQAGLMYQIKLIDKLKKDANKVKVEVNRERIKAVIDKFNADHITFKNWHLLTDDEISEEHWTESSQFSLLDLKYLDDYMELVEQLVDTYISVCNRFITIYDSGAVRKKKAPVDFKNSRLKWNFDSDTLYKIFDDLISIPYFNTGLPVLQTNAEQIKQLIHLRFVDKDGKPFPAVFGKDKIIDKIIVNKKMDVSVFVDIFFQFYRQFKLKSSSEFIIPNSLGEMIYFIRESFVNPNLDPNKTTFKDSTLITKLNPSNAAKSIINRSKKVDMRHYFLENITVVDYTHSIINTPRKFQKET
jgi:hypothetical protein